MWFIVVSFLCIYQIEAKVARCQYDQTRNVAESSSTSHDHDVIESRQGTSEELMCHTRSSFDNSKSKVSWYFQKKEGSEWQKYPFKWGEGKFGHRHVELVEKTKLLILSTSVKAEGLYKCETENLITKNITAKYFKLQIFDCSPTRQEPLVYISPKEQYANIGDKVTVNCSADFNCDNNEDNSVDWMIKVTTKSDVKCITDLQSPNYYVKLEKRALGRRFLSSLTITVREEDFDKKFGCMISSEKNIESKPELHYFQLKQKSIVIHTGPKKWVVGVATVSSLVAIVMVIIVAYCYGPCLRIKCRICCGRIQTPKERETKTYDTVIFHDDEEPEDKKLVWEVKKNLKEKKVRVATVLEGEDIKAGKDEQTQMQELLANSASVIFLIPETGKCHRMQNLFNYAERGVIPLPYIFIVKPKEIPKTRTGMLSKGLNHFKRPKLNNVNRFCYKIMLELPAFNRGNNPVPNNVEHEANQNGRYINGKTDFNKLKFCNNKDNDEEEVKNLLKEEVDMKDIKIENVPEREMDRYVEDDDGDESEEDSTTVSTQAEVHHSNSSVESLLLADLHNDDMQAEVHHSNSSVESLLPADLHNDDMNSEGTVIYIRCPEVNCKRF